MSTETGSDQPRGADKPNEEGFAGDPTTPQPEQGTDDDIGDRIAVPGDDLTRPLMQALDDVGSKDDA
jgi:hypothetical protein